MARYILFGAGAIGSIVGVNLYRSGRDAILVGRGPHIQAIRKDGLKLKVKGEIRRIKIDAIEDLSGLTPKADDRILVTVKSQHTAAAVESLSRAYTPQAPVVALQNAICNEETIAARFESVYGALVEFCGNFLEPGTVEQTRNNLIGVGKFPDGFDSVAASVCQDLGEAGFQVERDEKVMELKWWKLVVNTNNGLLALLGSWLQKGFSDPEIYPLMADVMQESFQVLEKAGIHTRPPLGFPPLELAIQKLRSGERAREEDLPIEQRTYPSTWQDLHLKRGSTEVEFLNGEIERIGRRLGVPTPRNSLILQLVSEIARNREPPGKYSPQQIKSLFASF
jgi:2-dehydropantoate 2-reductase